MLRTSTRAIRALWRRDRLEHELGIELRSGRSRGGGGGAVLTLDPPLVSKLRDQRRLCAHAGENFLDRISV